MQHPTTIQKIFHEIWDIIKFIAPIIIVVVLVRTFVAQPFIVDGESSAPNFHTGHYLIVDELSYHFREPARGDVIVLRYPLQPSRFFLKRIIGLPGDRVVIQDGKVFIYNTEHPDGYVLNEPYQKQATFAHSAFQDVTLEQGQYYVMGDNRAGSDDSRSWGILPRKDIIGHAWLRLYPFSLIGITPASVDDFKN